MAKHIEQTVEELVQDILQGSDMEVVDVEYVREHAWYLRVYLDKKNGIEIEDCQKVSEKLEKILDEKDLIKEAYILEVSSPGLDRVLRKERDFEREMEKVVDVTLYAPIEGKKSITGTLTGYDRAEKSIMLDEKLKLSLKNIAQVRLHLDF
ncbi:ribosome maturation factor RimP [Selenomonas sputigena]|uniref:Ribosome maturation factor RimP n=1 Tax=Selenomonas sputigena TaxID=69823 RepID=A0ABV3X258_9FIRM